MERRYARPVTGQRGKWLTGGAMPEDELAAKIAGYRETAETLRGIAERLRFEPRRGNQLRALADGFERFALLLKRASIKRIAADSTASASSPARRSARPAASGAAA